MADTSRERLHAALQLLLEPGALQLALRQPLLADLELGLELRLPERQRGLVLLDGADAPFERLLVMEEPLLVAVLARHRRRRQRLRFLQLRLARGELLLA